MYLINKLRMFVASRPPFPGRRFFLKKSDDWLGYIETICRGSIKMPIYPSSKQDATFLPTAKDSNPVLKEAILKLQSDSTFIDIGANIGYYSALASRHFDGDGTIISVEPSSREFWRLARTKDLNAHSCRWHLVNMALSDVEFEILPLDIHVGHSGMNRIAKVNIETNESRSTGSLTACVSLNVIWKLYKLAKIDLLKIDVEGFELVVLKGAENLLRNKKVSMVVVEITDKYLQRAGHSKDQLYGYMKSLGYKPTVNDISWQYDEVFTIE